jgi:hypothetical protein
VTTTTPPVPKNSDELAEFMADPGRFKPVLNSPEDLKAFIEATPTPSRVRAPSSGRSSPRRPRRASRRSSRRTSRTPPGSPCAG